MILSLGFTYHCFPEMLSARLKMNYFQFQNDSDSMIFSLFTNHCFQVMLRRQTKNKTIFSFRIVSSSMVFSLGFTDHCFRVKLRPPKLFQFKRQQLSGLRPELFENAYRLSGLRPAVFYSFVPFSAYTEKITQKDTILFFSAPQLPPLPPPPSVESQVFFKFNPYARPSQYHFSVS